MMRSKNTIFSTFIILFNLCYGQFRSEIPLKRVPSNLNGQLNSDQYLSIFDLDKFEMNQSFNMSMITTGVESFSLLSFSNQMSYSLMKNLKLNADVTIYNNPSAFQNRNSISGLDVAYNAGLIFQPTKNSFLKVQVIKSPQQQQYQNFSPFNIGHSE